MARLATVRDGFAFAFGCAAAAAVAALAAAALAPSFARDALHAAAGAVVLGALLKRKPPVWVALLTGALATAALAAAGLPWQRDWRPALFAGAAIMIVALLAHGILHRRRIDPRASDGPRELLAAIAVATALLPAASLLADLLAFDGGRALPAWPGLQPLALHWLAAAFAVVALLPVWLTARVGPSDPYDALAALAVLAIAFAGLLHWAGWWGLLALPLLVCALRCDARTTALLGLLAAIVLAGVAGHAWSGRDELLSPGFPLAAAAIGLSVAIVLSVPLALLATHRDQAEADRQVSRDQLQTLLQSVPALVATFGTDLRHRFANRRYLQWHDKGADEVIGHSLHELFGERSAAAMATTVQRAMAGLPQRLQLRTANGRELEARYEPHFGVDGAIDGFQLLAQDVSWRRQGERRQRALLDALADPVAVLAATGDVIEVNTRLERLFGLSRSELVGRPFADRLVEAARERFLRPLQGEGQGRGGVVLRQVGGTTDATPSPPNPPLEGEGFGTRELTDKARIADAANDQRIEGGAGLRARRADGSEFPIELALAPMADEEGALWVLVAREPDRCAVDKHDAGERAPVQARDQAQVTLDAMADAVVVCDAKLCITAFNPMAASLTGWSEREALGRPLDDVVALCNADSGEPMPSLLHEAMRLGKPVRAHDDRALVRRDGSRAPIEESAAPIRDMQGLVSGGVLLFHDVSQVRAATENISHLAQHDFLTNLPNRVLLQDRLQQALARVARGDKGALLYLDLDRFKPINDRFGHPVGDRVLQEIAKRLVAGVREDDTVSRQGGDEFVLLLVRLADPRDAARVAGKLIHAIEQPIRVDGQDLSVSASIGIALYPQDGRDTRTLMKQADTALYHAKETGRGRYCYFTDTMSESADVRMRTEHDLRLALANEDFFLVYQPRVQMPERRVIGAEALVRWRRAEGESVPLEEFMPVAEETGLVVQIDEWVLRQACHQAQAWQKQGLPPVPVTVNVSLSRFDAERLLGQVQAALAGSSLAPELLEIEFREGPLFAQGKRGHDLVAALKALGVRVAVDDFGSGASGVGALAGYRFDTLKIDRAFVAGLPEDAEKAAITHAIAGIGRALRITVAAKGVETPAQEELLLRQGCGQMQGFLYSAPLEAERFADWHTRSEAAAALRRA